MSESTDQVTEKQLTVDSVINWQLPVLVILFVSIVFIAIKTVVHRHESRTAYMKLQTLEKERDKLAAQWSRLKLEQATSLNQVKVEQYARWDLNMKMPKLSEVKIIQQPKKVVIVKSQAIPSESKLMVSEVVVEEPSEMALEN